ncbi:MAG TPA: hypothetical protein VGD35_11465, partial [Chitinophaga sp.]
MRKYLLTAIFCCALMPIYAQYPAYYDAQYIYKSCFDNEERKFINHDELYDAIKKYYPKGTELSLPKLRENPFWLPYVPDGEQLSGVESSYKGFISSIGGLDVTTLAQGVAQPMIDRAKQELTIVFFNRFKKFTEEHREVKVLFPKTTDNLANLLAYSYPQMLPALQTGLFEDMKNLPYHIDDALELDYYRELLKKLPEVRIAIHSIRLVHEIESGFSNPAEVLEKFSTLREWSDPAATKPLQNMGNAAKVAALFSATLRNDPSQSHDDSRTWITIKEIKALTEDEVLFTIYLGLIYEASRKQQITFQSGTNATSFASLMEEQKDNILLFRNAVTELGEWAITADKIRKDIEYKKANHIELSKDDYYNYINTAIDVIEYAFSIAANFNDGIDIAQYTKLARNSNDLYRHIYREEYSQAVVNAVDVLTQVVTLVNDSPKDGLIAAINGINEGPRLSISKFGDVGKRKIEEIKELIATTTDAKLKSLLQQLAAYYYYKHDFADILSGIRDYGLFMANIVTAKTPDEVQATLDNAILPVGSSSIKKNTLINVAVQSYLGAFSRLGPPKDGVDIAWNSQLGVTAPIGISLSVGLKKGGSFSLFGSLFDLGAIVDY